MQFHRARRRLVDGWSDDTANQIYEQAKQLIRVQAASDPAVAKSVEAMIDLENDFFGMKFAPFGHNYLYGFNLREVFAETYEMANNGKHPMHDAFLAQTVPLVAYVRINFADTELGHRIREEFGMMGLLNMIVHPNITLLPGRDSEILAGFALVYTGETLYIGSMASLVIAPLCVLAEWAVSGWKKTAWTWGVGIGLTEVLSAMNTNEKGERQVAGWSIITYGIFGHFLMEIYKKPKLLKLWNLFKYPEFITLWLSGFGALSTVGSLIMDPGYPMGEKSGTGHVYHHAGLLYGAWLNR